ncbi:MAG: translation elongation factor G [Candidatus Schekmanbacteria bacterium RBG_16_38_11]|uniref:Elongation factor G n=1 Tax=Candidatus Schekmanbacteria bacterium RBG_16_38_11 TaxID=1817880 RepID=A0A1F7RZX1_9BACT|nr:MAG: translation elongation factor G [Candidatus Schekmanbacteria bacterium RBG_16_38_11]
MAEYDVNNMRNICVIGHGGDGKTSFCDAALFSAKTVERLGRVDNGTSKFDYDPDEIKKKATISTSLGFCEWKKHKINILDTPGDANFVGETKSSIRAADAVVIILDGHSGVKVQTQTGWEFAEESNLPKIVFINMMDKERANFIKVLDDLKKSFKTAFIPLVSPIGAEESFKGVVDLISKKAHVYKNGENGEYDVADIPADIKDECMSLREKLVESAVEQDEKMMEKYLEGEEIKDEDLIKLIRKGTIGGELVPVLCGSAIKNTGIKELLDAIVSFLPSPAERPNAKGKDPSAKEIERKSSVNEPFSALVFKTIADPYTGKLTLFRIYSGKLASDSQFYNFSKKRIEKFGQIFFMQGKDHIQCRQVQAGDIAAFSKLKETATGDTICDSDKNAIIYDFITLPSPMISFAVEPKTKGDEEKVSTSLSRLCEEDLTLKVKREPQTRELLISGMGVSHIEMAVEKLKRKFGVDVTIKTPKIPYRETIKASAKSQGKYKRQSGGRGQYGDTWIEIEPLPRGKGFEFVDKIVGGVIPKNYIPSVEKGIVEAMQFGELAGYPVVNIRVTLYDGSFHEVDSSDMAFKIAGSMGFKKAFMEAKPILLEPVMNVEVVVPDDCMGDIIGDINSRRGKMKGVEPKNNNQLIKATAPLAEMLNYAPDLKSISGGRGFFTMEFSHYEEVPAHLSEKIIAESKKEKESEE